MSRRVVAVVLVVALALLALGGSVIAQEATPEGGRYVGFVPPALTSPFHVAMVEGATARAEELGWTLEVQAPASEGDTQAFVTTVQQLLEKASRLSASTRSTPNRR